MGKDIPVFIEEPPSEPPGSADSCPDAYNTSQHHESHSLQSTEAVEGYVGTYVPVAVRQPIRARSQNGTVALKARPSLGQTGLGQARAPVYKDAAHFIAENRPEKPVHLIRPHVLRGAAQWFLQHFPGTVLYAVKANPSPDVIKELWASGIRHFDVASLAEVELIAGLFPKAKLHFMHPVKSREAIRKAYFTYGVRDFVIDSAAELFKLVEETRGAKDLGILIRLAVSNGHAFHSLTGKFGADNRLAAELLVKARKSAQRVGIAFHVGQQTMNGKAYGHAMAQVGEVIRMAKINPDIIDVGGGFPVAFPGLVPPDMHSYMDNIREAFDALNLPKKTKLWCEPGRALVQESGSLITKVELRKDNRLYINDGFYGALFDAGNSKLTYPVRVIRADGRPLSQKMIKFVVYGPTCDSIDVMKTPLLLPADIDEGDYLEFGQTGGYAVALQSGFNGFGADAKAVEVRDMPMLETPGYWQDDADAQPATLVAF
jgi:ornithine decarboxylase